MTSDRASSQDPGGRSRLQRMRAKSALIGATALVSATMAAPAAAQAPTQKPNILFIMGDDIGWMQPSIYHQGLMVGETPNIDRIGREGAKFMTYYAEQSCTAGRNAFFTGMHPLRTGMIPPQLPGSPSYLRPGTPAIAKFLLDRELPRHQQDADRADGRAGLPEHADPRAAPGSRGGRSGDHPMPDAATSGALVQVVRRHRGEPVVQG